MTNQVQQLIEAIKALPGHQVFPGANGGSVHIVRASKNRIGQLSVWLGRKNTLQNLQNIIDQAQSDSSINRIIVHMGRVWRVIGVGAVRDGNTFCHLISLDEKIKGQFIQINDWVDSAVLANAKGL